MGAASPPSRAPPAPGRPDADGWKEASQPPTGRDSALLMAALPSKVTDGGFLVTFARDSQLKILCQRFFFAYNVAVDLLQSGMALTSSH
jgi:hypothetical protein